MKYAWFLMLCGGLWACSPQKTQETQNLSITGTWRLLSGTVIRAKDTVTTDYTKNQTMIKVINATHFSFLRHDLKQGKDSTAAIFGAGGGRYVLKGKQYTEFLEYCNYREWEGHQFDFTLRIENDTLIQEGVEKIEKLGINQINIEKYVRLKDQNL